jgi:hypothetical protein
MNNSKFSRRPRVQPTPVICRKSRRPQIPEPPNDIVFASLRVIGHNNALGDVDLLKIIRLKLTPGGDTLAYDQLLRPVVGINKLAVRLHHETGDWSAHAELRGWPCPDLDAEWTGRADQRDPFDSLSCAPNTNTNLQFRLSLRIME